MAKGTAARVSFNGGEHSPIMAARADLEKYQTACEIQQNIIPAVQGAAVRRGGTRFVAEAKDSTRRSWLVRFSFSSDQSFALEFGEYYIRFFTQGAPLLSGGIPYEIASPYSAADLINTKDGSFRLSIVPDLDVLYIAHPSFPLQKLIRSGNTNWAISNAPLVNGPFRSINTTKTTTVYASATSGTVTLTASADIFFPAMVGGLFYLEPQDPSSIKPWTAGQEWKSPEAPLNEFRRSDGKTYQCTTPGGPITGKFWRTGPNKPIHSYGTASDGGGKAIDATNCTREGLDWLFIDAGFGHVEIISYQSATQVTAIVRSEWPLPAGVVGSTNASYRWAHGFFSNHFGWPEVVTFFRERLTLLSGLDLNFSVAGDFNNFAAKTDAGLIVADRAAHAILSSDSANVPSWAMPGDSLLIGTEAGEFVCSEITSSDPFGPGNIKIHPSTGDGARGVDAIRAGEAVVFIQTAGRKVIEAAYDIQRGGISTTDMTVLSDHISLSGITQIAWHREPYSVIWGVRADGVLIAMTYNRKQQVVGWHRHPLGGGGIVESVVVIPQAAAGKDQLWLQVKRTINGVTRRYIEYLVPEYAAGDAQSSAFYVDCGGTYSGAPATVISGITHLEGATVQVLVDGGEHPDVVVTGGAITLQRAGSVVNFGYGFTSILKPTRLELTGATGSSHGKIRRVTSAHLRLLNTLGIKTGPSLTALTPVIYRSASTPMGSPPPFFSGDVPLNWPGDYDFTGDVFVVQSQPLPMTVLAIIPDMQSYDP